MSPGGRLRRPRLRGRLPSLAWVGAGDSCTAPQSVPEPPRVPPSILVVGGLSCPPNAPAGVVLLHFNGRESLFSMIQGDEQRAARKAVQQSSTLWCCFFCSPVNGHP